MEKKLNFGSGKKKMKGYVNADIHGADVNFDFNKFPYPFKDDTFDYIYACHTIEHLENLFRVFEELHRICKDGATIEIISPFWLHPAASSVGQKHFHFSSDWLRPIVDTLT